jgi:AsmA protein
MSKFKWRVLIAVAAILVLIALGALLGRSLLGANVQSRLEADASEALGMDVRIGGPVALRFFPKLHVTLKDVRITNHGAQVAAAEEAQLGIELRSLWGKDLKLREVRFQGAKITIKRDKSGHLNIDRAPKPDTSSPAADIASVSFAQSSFLFSDAQSGKDFAADNCSLELHDLQLAPGTSTGVMKTLSFAGDLACEQLRTKSLTASAVKAAVHGRDGIFKLDPITLKIFGGQGQGTVAADFTAPESLYRIHSTVAKLQIADFSKSALPEKLGQGTLEFAANLTMRGTVKNGVIRTASGDAALHGDNLVLDIGDLDKEFSRYESTQNFNLLDVGAFFLAGPIGLAVTKGYDYARILKKSAGRTTIRTLASTWRVEHGVAEAQDVALATAENRVALKGGLNFVSDSYEDVTIALIGPKGCVRVEQKIHGAFRDPQVDKPNVVTAVAGPARKLINKGRSLLGAKCSVFYSGVVASPK